MSETVSLSYEVGDGVEASELSYQPEQSDSIGPETVDEWIRPLYGLVMANASEVRKWSWMGGAEAPLSTSMWSHPGVSPGNLQEVMSDISESLTNPIEETEDSEEDTPEEEEPAQTEDTEKEPQRQADHQAKPQKQPANRIEKSPRPKAADAVVAEVEATTDLGRSESKQPTQTAAKATPAKPLEERIDVTSAKNPREPEAKAPIVKKNEARNPAPELVVKEEAQSPGPAIVQVEIQLDEIKPLIQETIIEPEQPELVVDESDVNMTAEIIDKVEPEIIFEQDIEVPELVQLPTVELENHIVADDIAEASELNDETITPLEDELVLINLEEETVLEQPEEVVLGAIEIGYPLAEQVETSDTNTEEVNEILNEILTEEVEPDEELEELLTELFEALGIDHTHGVVESLESLMPRGRLVGAVEKLKKQEEKQDPQIGTGLVVPKQPFIQETNQPACALGRSAILLALAA